MSYYSGSNRRNHHSGYSSSRPNSLYGSPNSLNLLGTSSQSSPYLSSVNPSSYSSSPYSSYGSSPTSYSSVLGTGASSTLSSPSLYSALLQGFGSRSSSPSYSTRSSYSPTGYGSPTSSRYPSRSSSFNKHGPYKSSTNKTDSKSSSTHGSSNSLATSEGYESEPEKSDHQLLRLSSPVNTEERTKEPPVLENGEIDYKKLYEESQLENERLREKLRQTEDDLLAARSQTDITTVQHKNSLSEVDKRERRAMERKLSEMEEELKQLQKLKADNERLRAENRALTRVLSNLTTSNSK